MVASAEINGGHQSDTKSDSLSLGGHKDDLLVHLDVGLVSKQTGDHQLGSVADGVDGRVLDHKPLVAGEEGLERSDHPSEVRLCCRQSLAR